jgi:electron-transferring-flavoprotein dehydrogenase
MTEGPEVLDKVAASTALIDHDRRREELKQGESLEFDVLIVGGGPAGLSAAIRIKQLNPATSVCLIEKGAEIGAHILSGAIMDPRAISELIPDWKARGAPLGTAVSHDIFMILTEKGGWPIPNLLLPDCFSNHGNYIVSLGNVCRWLGQRAEALGVEIYPGFAGAELLYTPGGAVKGVATGEMGVGRDYKPTGAYQPGMELLAKYTLFAEGCRGHLGKQLEFRYRLRVGADPQVYGLGIKELWEVAPDRHARGLVLRTAGWPLPSDTYGGSFCYHYGENLVAIGFVVGLGYSNPYLSPFEEFQRYKTHPKIRPMLEGGKRISYGARAMSAGGLQALPKMTFPGGALIGDDAGLLNASRIKGSHAAIKSGILAAEAVSEALSDQRGHDVLTAYTEQFRQSWLYEELYTARNFKPWMSKGLYLGSLMFGIDQTVLRGKAPWTLGLTADHVKLKKAVDCTPIEYPKPDGVISFDRRSSVFLSNTRHEENQPCHLTLQHSAVPIVTNLVMYAGPEQRYCPAGVFGFLRDESGYPHLQINAQDCVHCMACDIKDPTQNINWVVPQGGEGPVYPGM